MTPYIIAGIIIIFIIAICVLVVKRIYSHRTQEPDINLNDIIGAELPAGVDLNDALGGIFRR